MSEFEAGSSEHEDAPDASSAFSRLLQADWEERFRDRGTSGWADRWLPDGERAAVTNTGEGMEFRAGPTFGEDRDHGVLWTRASFSGDIRVEYEYTRMDEQTRGVNIIYLHATGEGASPYVEDVAEWAALREVPAMRLYFEHMHAYHVSYAAFPNTGDSRPGYIRARRYRADGLNGTELSPDYEPAAFFATGVPHRMTVIVSRDDRRGDHIYLHVDNGSAKKLCHWHNTQFPPLDHGRIGLRHMAGRAARYRDFRVFERAR